MLLTSETLDTILPEGMEQLIPEEVEKYLPEVMEKGFLRRSLDALLPDFISFFWSVILAIVVFLIGKKLIKTFIKAIDKAFEKKDVEKGVATFLLSVIKFTAYLFLIVIILGLFGITTASISATVAALGVTAGFSLQGTLSNFAGGVLILITRPFKVGDYIRESTYGREGTVKRISIVYTYLTTVEGHLVIVPNGALAATSVINYTNINKRMVNEIIGVDYSSDIKKVKEVLYKLVESAPDRIESEPMNVFVAEYADSTINMGFRYWVPQEKYWTSKWDTLEKIKEVFDENGISIAFNQLDVHVKQD